MNTKNSLIYIVEDDIPCGKLILYFLKKNGYNNVILYTSEKECLNNFIQHPEVLITDYRLKSMDGIQLIRKAKKIHPDFYCILLSGMCYDEIFITGTADHYIDKYIHKGLDSMNELVQTLDHLARYRYVGESYQNA